MRLEHPDALEDGDIAGQGIGRAEGEREHQLGEHELADASARLDALTGHLRDELGEVAIDLDGELPAGDPHRLVPLVEDLHQPRDVLPPLFIGGGGR